MNFLQICQSLIQECGISGTMATTLSQTGEMSRVVNWITQAWSEIQTMHDDWGFMRSSYLNQGAGVSFTTTSGRSVYPLGIVAGTNCMVAAANFANWDQYSFRNYSTTNALRSDEIFMYSVTYDEWRDAYMYGAQRQVVTRPIAVAIAPDNSVCLGPPSNGLYTIEGDYWVAPQLFALDADVPTGLPIRYHMLIVYRAMKKYAGYEAAAEVATRAEDEYNPLFRSLEGNFGPRMMEGATLA